MTKLIVFAPSARERTAGARQHLFLSRAIFAEYKATGERISGASSSMATVPSRDGIGRARVKLAILGQLRIAYYS